MRDVELRHKDRQDDLKKIKAKEGNNRLKIGMSSRLRRAIATVVVVMVIGASFFLVPVVTAADPAIGYASPDDASKFADQSDGDGVNWTINVTDGDGDLAWVKLYSNDSGSWRLFYDSGALGGVAYRNASGLNGNWTGSWTTYWWNISANDGATHDTVYSFTTRYQWGYPQMAVLNDVVGYIGSVPYKNASNDYYLWYDDGGSIDVKNSTTGTNWSLEPKSDVHDGELTSGGFTYNNTPYVLYTYNDYLWGSYWDGSAWQSASVGGPLQIAGDYRGVGADAIYYDGVWNLVRGYFTGTGTKIRLAHYTGYFPSSMAWVVDLDTGYQWDLEKSYWYPRLAVLNGTLYLTYKDDGEDLHWQTYNGVVWTDKGDVGGDSGNLGGGSGDTYKYYSPSMVKDPVNHQVVCVYINNSGDLVYRVTDNLTSWSDSYLILSKGIYDIRCPHVEFIDRRLVISFSHNLRTNYNIYTINSPGYTGSISGLNYTLNRIQWPDAAPDDTNVNSTVFVLKNIDNRNITTIMWHFDDIGEITAASNIKVWTNMSGVWNDIGTCDASGNVTTLDISGEMLGGGEWIPGNYTWWKMEILDVGPVSEDFHTTDEDIYYKITLA